LRDTLAEKVWEAARREGLFSAGEGVVVGVSGGPDSTVLAAVLAGDAEGLGLRLHLAHLNHGWRGAESDRDEAAAKALAERLGLPITIARLRRAQGGKERTEEGAREARYRFLKRVAKEVGATKVVVGHTADDQVETVLLNLTRGGGPRGMAGMPFLKDGWLGRPLLGIWRKEILAYCARRRLPYVEDSSNVDERYARNWVRVRLLPLLEERFGAKVKENILRSAGLAGGLSRALEAWEGEGLAGVWAREAEGVTVRVEDLARLPEALRWAVLHSCVRAASEGARDVGLEHIRALDELCRQTAGTKERHLPHGVRARREYGILRIKRVSHATAGAVAEWGPLAMAVPGRTEVAPAGVWLEAREASGEEACEAVGEQGARAVALDPRRVRLPLWVRSWRAGDRLEPKGMRGSKKLQDLFVDSRVPARERRRVPVVTDASGRIVWVAGLRAARGVTAGRSTARALILVVGPGAQERGVR
jgi:tRNA(Ile)-lysidine synthase